MILRSRLVVLLTLMLAAALAGCASRSRDTWLVPVEAAAPVGQVQPIFVATTREFNSSPGVYYTSARSQQLSYARIDVSVPPTHKPGQIEWPRTRDADPAKNFAVRDAELLDADQSFLNALNAELAKRPPGKRRVSIFIHGYNNTFGEGLYRTAQLAADSKGFAVAVYFAWASKGELSGYGYDFNSATAARDGLEHVLRLLYASHAEKVDIIAHSMGNWVTLEAIRQIKIAEDQLPISKAGLVVLASPDVDIDVFKSEMRRIGRPKVPFYIIVSQDDVALRLSGFLSGRQNRVGAGYNDAELQEFGATVINMTKVKSDGSFNHDKFVLLATLAPGIGPAVASSLSRPQDRPPSLAGMGICTPVLKINCN